MCLAIRHKHRCTTYLDRLTSFAMLCLPFILLWKQVFGLERNSTNDLLPVLHRELEQLQPPHRLTWIIDTVLACTWVSTFSFSFLFFFNFYSGECSGHPAGSATTLPRAILLAGGGPDLSLLALTPQTMHWVFQSNQKHFQFLLSEKVTTI